MNKNRLYKRTWETIKAQSLEYSLPEVKRNITSFGVLINGKPEHNQLAWVFDNDDLSFDTWPKRQNSDFSKLVTLYENNDFLIVNKPTGVVVEPGTGHNQDNLISHFTKLLNQPVLTVHRLDKDTSGLMLIAKNQQSRDLLQDLFRARRVTKKYLAVTNGLVDKVYDIVNWQLRDRDNPLRQKFFWTQQEAQDYGDEPKQAASLIKPICTCSETNQSLVEVSIFTGRMHQIRLQCQALGFALSHDPVYKDSEPVEYNPPVDAKYTIIAKRNKYGYEYFKESKNLTLDTGRIINNPNLKAFLPVNPVAQVDSQKFAKLKDMIFPMRNYCLMSNFLSFPINNRVITCNLVSSEDIFDQLQ